MFSDRQNAVLQLLSRHSPASKALLQVHVDRHFNKKICPLALQRDLGGLMKHGVIDKDGNGRRRKYFLKTPPQEPQD